MRNSNQVIDQATTLVIPGGKWTKEMTIQELERVMENYKVAEQARDSFLAGEISLDEYMQLLEMANMNIDGYLATLEFNLNQFRFL